MTPPPAPHRPRPPHATTAATATAATAATAAADGGTAPADAFHVRRLGPPGGPAVVLVHGLLTDSLASYYFTVAPGLAAAGLDVVMYDQRGHGRSPRPASGYSLDAFTTDLEHVLDRLGVTGPVHLVGNSFGGTVAFHYAARHPERAAGLLLIESEPATARWAAKLDRILGSVLTDLAGNETAALAWITEHFGAHTARLAKASARLVRTTTIARDVPASRVLDEEGVRSVRCPVVAVYGEASDLAAQAPWLESLLPRCRTVVVPGHEHSVLVEAPGLVLELALDLVRSGARARTPEAAAARPAGTGAP